MTSEKKSQSQIKRQAIINAANKAFKEFGVQATSMDKLAEMANVSKRTVYNHFAKKEDLVLFLVSDMCQQAMTKASISYDASVSLDEQLAALIHTEINLNSSQDFLDLCRVIIGHLFYHPEALQQEINKLCNHATSLKNWIKAAVQDDKLAIEDIDLAYGQLDALITGQSFWPQLLKLEPILDKTNQQRLIDETVKIFLTRYQIPSDA